jgi:uncharacterized membrane protein YhdT
VRRKTFGALALALCAIGAGLICADALGVSSLPSWFGPSVLLLNLVVLSGEYWLRDENAEAGNEIHG